MVSAATEFFERHERRMREKADIFSRSKSEVGATVRSIDMDEDAQFAFMVLALSKKIDLLVEFLTE